VRVAPNPTSSVEVFDSEADILQCRIAEQVVAWFSLAGVARSRGKQKRRAVAFLWKQREKMRDEAGASGGVPRGEEEEGGWHARHEGHGEGGGRARGRQRRVAAVRCGHAKQRQGRRGVLTGGPGAYSNGRR
jgi:hypothetical protein